MKFAPPLSNKLAFLATVAAAAGFFILLMMLPSPHHASRSGPSTIGESSVPAQESGQALFATRCTQCHALPALTHRTEEDWRVLVLKMNRYMRQTGRQYLSDDQVTVVTRYILQNQK